MAVQSSLLRGRKAGASGKTTTPRKDYNGKLPKMCLDWRVLVGLAVVGVGIYVVAPGTVVAALPILSLAACPLSMLLMMTQVRMGDHEQPMMT